MKKYAEVVRKDIGESIIFVSSIDAMNDLVINKYRYGLVRAETDEINNLREKILKNEGSMSMFPALLLIDSYKSPPFVLILSASVMSEFINISKYYNMKNGKNITRRGISLKKLRSEKSSDNVDV